MLAICKAQSQSLQQHLPKEDANFEDILNITLAKGGTSVLADMYIVDPVPTQGEELFSFAFGFALQVVDDIQDMEVDAKNEQQTIVTLSPDPRCVVRRLAHLMTLLLPGDTIAERGMRAMCMTMVFKQVARVKHMFDDGFLQDCELLCPLPMTAMSKLKGMKTLLKMIKQDRI